MTDQPTPDTDVDVSVLSKDVRRELASLRDGDREAVEVLLARARLALLEDPTAAVAYTNEAVRIASRVGVVREAAGVAAYHAGDFVNAKKQLQAARRIAGRDDLIPLLADCERGLGNPQRCLEICETPEARQLRGEEQAELILVQAGAREDLGEVQVARALLATAAQKTQSSQPWAARMYYAYAASLLDAGEIPQAREWFSRSALADQDGELDSSDRIAEIDDRSA